MYDNPSDMTWIHCDHKGVAESELWAVIPATEAKYANKNAFHLRSIFGKALETPNGLLDNSVHIQQGTFDCLDGQTWSIREI
ncbi:MAG: hypothetical protein KDD45_06805 [Bdellovibrionales bacterium]|nr:hypothetical protein [Bdellovibrionales bacterium]